MNARSSPAPAPIPSPQPPHTYPSTPQQQYPPSSNVGIHGVVETHHAVKHTHDRSGKKMMNQYIVMETLGKGMHGTVRRGIDSLTGELVAIKIVERVPKHKRLGMHAPRRPHARAGLTGAVSTNAAMRTTEDKIRREIAIMKKCHHPNVVQLKEVIDDPHNKRIFLILEYMQGGEVKWRSGPPVDLPLLTVEQIRNIFRQVILGLEYLHYQGIIHRDIKPANLLLKSDGTVKISDFGVSHFSYALRLGSATTTTTAESPSLLTRTIRTSSPSPRRARVRSGGTEGDDFGRFGPGGGTDVEDVLMDESDLAKTAGSPAFFAPELCHQGDLSGLAASFSVQTATSKSGMFGGGDDSPPSTSLSVAPSAPLLASSSALSTEAQPHRSLSGSSKHTYKATAAGEGTSTVRAPSSAASSSRPPPSRQQSNASQQQTPTIPTSSSALSNAAKEPPPITAAIDVWALGVTLYCLLFGRPPFNASTEFMLYKIIPTEEFEVPERMGRDGRRTGGRDGRKRRRRETMKPTRRTREASESDESEGRSSLVGGRSRSKQEGRGEEALEDEDGDDEDDLEEGCEVIEILERLLEKDPVKRISLHDLKRMPWVLRGLPNPSQWLTENDPRREEMVVIQDSDVNDATLFKRARFKRVITKLKEKTKGALGGLLGGLGLGIGRSRSKSTGSVNEQVGEKRERSRTGGGGGEEPTPTMPGLSSFPGPGSGTVSAPPGRTSTPSGVKKGYRASLPLSVLQTSSSGGYSSPASPSPSQPQRSPIGLWSRIGHSSSAGGTPMGNDLRESSLRTPRSGSPVAGSSNVLVIRGDDEEDGGYFPRRAAGGEQTDGGNTTSATDVPTRTPKARRASATVLLAPPSGGMFRRTSSMSGNAESPTGTSGGKVLFGNQSPASGSGWMMGRPKPSMESVDTAVTSSTTSASAASGSASVDLGRSKPTGGSKQKGREAASWGDQPPATPKGGWLKRWGSSRRRKGVVGGATQPLTPLVPPDTHKSPTTFGGGQQRPHVARRSVSALESGSDRGSSGLSILAASSASALRYRPSTEVFTDDSSMGARSTASLSPIAHYGGVGAGVRSVRSAGGYHDTDNDEMDSVRSGTRISFSFSDDSDEDEDGGEGGAVREPNAMMMLGSGGFPVRNRGLGWEPLYPQQQPSRQPQLPLHGGGGSGTSPPTAGASSSTASSPGSHSPLGLGSSHLHHGSSSPSMAYSYSSPSSHSQSQMHHSNSMHSQLQLQHPNPIRQRSSNLSLELLHYGPGGGGSFHATTSSPSPLANQSFPATGGIAGGASRTSFSEGCHDNIEEEGDDAEDEEEEEFLQVKRKGEPGARARSMESERSVGAASRR